MAHAINTVHDLRRAFRIGPYAWPGGYPTFYLTEDGDALCHDCARFHRRELLEAIADDNGSGWRVVCLEVNYEEPDLQCDHCHKLIPSAYVD